MTSNDVSPGEGVTGCYVVILSLPALGDAFRVLQSRPGGTTTGSVQESGISPIGAQNRQDFACFSSSGKRLCRTRPRIYGLKPETRTLCQSLSYVMFNIVKAAHLNIVKAAERSLVCDKQQVSPCTAQGK